MDECGQLKIGASKSFLVSPRACSCVTPKQHASVEEYMSVSLLLVAGGGYSPGIR